VRTHVHASLAVAWRLDTMFLRYRMRSFANDSVAQVDYTAAGGTSVPCISLSVSMMHKRRQPWLQCTAVARILKQNATTPSARIASGIARVLVAAQKGAFDVGLCPAQWAPSPRLFGSVP
jgi:hypothetical protein